MPSLQFKGKSVIETYHHTVPHHRLDFVPELSVLPKGEKPGKTLPDWPTVARYIFYTETSREIDSKALNETTGFIGSTPAAGGTSYYLLYTPNQREDREVSLKWLAEALKRDQNRNWVIYTERIWLHQEDLRQFEREHERRIRTMLVPFNLR